MSTLADSWSAFLRTITHARTHAEYHRTFVFWSTIHGNIAPELITPELLQQFVEDLSEWVAPATVRKHCTQLNAYLKFVESATQSPALLPDIL